MPARSVMALLVGAASGSNAASGAASLTPRRGAGAGVVSAGAAASTSGSGSTSGRKPTCAGVSRAKGESALGSAPVQARPRTARAAAAAPAVTLRVVLTIQAPVRAAPAPPDVTTGADGATLASPAVGSGGAGTGAGAMRASGTSISAHVRRSPKRPSSRSRSWSRPFFSRQRTVPGGSPWRRAISDGSRSSK